MTEPTKPTEAPKPKTARPPKVDLIGPSDIVDVWRLFEHYPQNYPNLKGERPEAMRSHMLSSIMQPNFLGVIARYGKKPVGMLTGFVAMRPYGQPNVFFSFWMCFVKEEARKSGVGKAMLARLFDLLKRQGVNDFESIIEPEYVPLMEHLYGSELKVVSHRIVGKVTKGG